MSDDFSIPGNEFLTSVRPAKPSEVPGQTIDPILSDLEAINNIYENLFQKVNFVEVPTFSETDLPQATDPIKREKLIEYITHTHELLNKCFNRSIETMKVIANKNYELSLSEQDPIKKSKLENSLNEIRLMMEITSSIITKDGLLKFREGMDSDPEKHIHVYIGRFPYKGQDYNIILTAEGYPLKRVDKNTGIEASHLPSIKFQIRKYTEDGRTLPHSKFRFDIDSPTGVKFDPYDRRIVFDINYPGEDSEIKYDDVGQIFTHHFLVEEGIDFHQFYHMARVFRNNLLLN